MNRFRRFLICILVFGLLFTYSVPYGFADEGEDPAVTVTLENGTLKWTALHNAEEASNEYYLYITDKHFIKDSFSYGSHGTEDGAWIIDEYDIDLNNEIDYDILMGKIDKAADSTYHITLKILNPVEAPDGSALFTWETDYVYDSPAELDPSFLDDGTGSGDDSTTDPTDPASGEGTDPADPTDPGTDPGTDPTDPTDPGTGDQETTGGEGQDIAPAPDSFPKWESNNWVRILRDEYTDCGRYSYYYDTPSVNSSTYRIRREDNKTGKTKLLLKYKANHFPEYYTNGEKLVYLDYKLGSIIKVKDIKTGKTKKILDLTKFKTWKSTDTVLKMYLYGDYVYYTKYRGLNTIIYDFYKVNIKTGKQKLIKKGYSMVGTKDEAFAGSRYIPLRDKKKNLYIYDVKKSKFKKLGSKAIREINYIDGYWYYVNCAKPSAKTKKYIIYKRVASLAKKAKKVASFSCKYTTDDLMGFTNKSAFFMHSDKYSMEYRYAKKKFIKRKEMDVWYYIRNNMRFQ